MHAKTVPFLQGLTRGNAILQHAAALSVLHFVSASEPSHWAWGRLDGNRGTFTGFLIALVGIGGGVYLGHGKIGQILQPTAALIVFGGTIGAVLIQFPFPVVMDAAAKLKLVFFSQND